MVHCYAPADRPIRHVYLHEARQLPHGPARVGPVLGPTAPGRAQPASSPRSRAGAEWVRAPTETASTPARPAARAPSRVMPPHASVRARPATRATASRSSVGRHVVEQDPVRAGLERRPDAVEVVGLHLHEHARQLAARPRDRLGQPRAGEREVVVLHEHPVEEPHPVVAPPPATTAAFSRARMPGVVLRVSRTAAGAAART